MAVERVRAVRTALAAALIRGGADRTELLGRLRPPRVHTCHGPRTLAPPGMETPEQELAIALGDVGGGPRPRDRIRTEDPALLAADPHRWRTLAAAVPPALPDRPAGRRARHAWLEAQGWWGDPDASTVLVQALTSMEDDPGQGFTKRRLAAVALGRLGDPGAVPVLRRALEQEALEFEGRPGAGLGVQFPVRAVLLQALGELQDPATTKLLTAYLGLTRQGASGGLHLAAMGALWTLGDPAPLRPLLDAEEVVAANAAGLLVALGDTSSLARIRDDARPRIRAALAPLD